MATRNILGTIQVRRDTSANWESRNPILKAGEFGFDTTNKMLKIGDGATPWIALLPFARSSPKTLEESSWNEIAQLSQYGYAKTAFKVGDEKIITLTNSETVTLAILGFNHDDLTTGGKVGITFGMKNVLATSYPMKSTTGNLGGWNESTLRTSTIPLLISQLPPDLQAVLKTVNKKTSAGNTSSSIITSADKLFLFSEVEIDATKVAVFINEGEQYEYWRTIKVGTVAANRIKKTSNGKGSAVNWWLRSVYVSNNNFISLVGTAGELSGNGSTSAMSVSYGFCI